MISLGSKVKIHYHLLVDGKTLDTSEGREPLAYTQGAGQIVEGLEEHLARLEEGVETRVTVPPAKGYGERDPEAIRRVAKTAFKEPDALAPGTHVQGRTQQGKPFQATISQVDEDHVTLDLNHPLAGKTLHFEVEIVEVRPPV